MSTPLEIDSSVPINLLYIYAHADKRFSNELDKHLNLLQQQGVITTWKSQDIAIDTDTDFPLDVQLDSMQIILLLISPEFIASSYCYGSEMEQILARYSAGTVAAISVLLRPTERQETPLKFLPVLPSKERAISTWSYHDDAFEGKTGRNLSGVSCHSVGRKSTDIAATVPALYRAKICSISDPYQ